jgi:hypothetical protein
LEGLASFQLLSRFTYGNVGDPGPFGWNSEEKKDFLIPFYLLSFPSSSPKSIRYVPFLLWYNVVPRASTAVARCPAGV